jgi:YidC/Oxa1 family membrane protein insertase
MISQLFTVILYQPLFNGLIGLYQLIPDMGVAIILLTIAIKFLLFRPSLSALKAQQANLAIQPKLKALQAKFKNNREELGRQLMAFYKEHRVSPLSSLWPVLLQLPILIALYQVFIAGLQTDPETHALVAKQVDHLYGGLKAAFATKAVDTTFFGLELAAKGNILLAVLAGALQFWQSKMLIAPKPAVSGPGAKDEAIAAATTRQMTYFLPVLTVVFGYQFPAGLALYWVVSTAFSVAQQYYFLRRHGPMHAPAAAPAQGAPEKPSP